MRITLTIDIDNNNNVIVNTNSNTPSNEDTIKETVSSNVEESKEPKTLGEKLSKGRYASRQRPRTEEYPFNVGDAKRELQKNNITIGQLASVLGIDQPKLRNIFRYDNRRFTRDDYNVILKAIDEITHPENI